MEKSHETSNLVPSILSHSYTAKRLTAFEEQKIYFYLFIFFTPEKKKKKSVIFNFKTFSTVFPGWKKSHETSNLVPSILSHSYPGKRLRRVLDSMSLIPPVADTFDYTGGF